MASRRTRKSISIPTNLVELVGNQRNFSAIVTMLLEENIERLHSIDEAEVVEYRRKKARNALLRLMMKTEERMADRIAELESRSFSTQIEELWTILEGLKNACLLLESILSGIEKDVDKREKKIRACVRSEIKKTIQDLR